MESNRKGKPFFNFCIFRLKSIPVDVCMSAGKNPYSHCNINRDRHVSQLHLFIPMRVCTGTGTHSLCLHSNSEETKRIMRRIKEHKTDKKQRKNEEKKNFAFSLRLLGAAAALAVRAACCFIWPASHQLCRYACVYMLAILRIVRRLEWMKCSVRYIRHIHQHRPNTFVANYVLHNQNERARSPVRVHSRSPLCIWLESFIFFWFHFLHCSAKIKSRKRKNETWKRKTIRESIFSFPFNVRRAHVMVCLHTKFRCVFDTQQLVESSRGASAGIAQVARTKKETQSFSCCSFILGFGSNKFRTQVIIIIPPFGTQPFLLCVSLFSWLPFLLPFRIFLNYFLSCLSCMWQALKWFPFCFRLCGQICKWNSVRK